MINGLGIVGWGVGGIEAEAAMLGQPVYFLTPDVVGVHLSGTLRAGVTATDLVLTITEMLRKAKVVGKFVEFFGEGAASLAVTDRATIANMAPEYGATMGFFPVDEETCQYLLATGRAEDKVDALRAYFKAQGLFGMPRKGDCDYTQTLELDLGQRDAQRRRPEAAAGSHRAAQPQADLQPAPPGSCRRAATAKKNELGKRFQQVRRSAPPIPHVTGGGDQEVESTPGTVRTGVPTRTPTRRPRRR